MTVVLPLLLLAAPELSLESIDLPALCAPVAESHPNPRSVDLMGKETETLRVGGVGLTCRVSLQKARFCSLTCDLRQPVEGHRRDVAAVQSAVDETFGAGTAHSSTHKRSWSWRPSPARDVALIDKDMHGGWGHLALRVSQLLGADEAAMRRQANAARESRQPAAPVARTFERIEPGTSACESRGDCHDLSRGFEGIDLTSACRPILRPQSTDDAIVMGGDRRMEADIFAVNMPCTATQSPVGGCRVTCFHKMKRGYEPADVELKTIEMTQKIRDAYGVERAIDRQGAAAAMRRTHRWRVAGGQLQVVGHMGTGQVRFHYSR